MSTRVRVLVMDSQSDHAETLRLLFESRGCVVLLARDAHDALAIVAAHRPDVLVIELDLLGASAVCGAVRSANPMGAFVAGIAGLGVDTCQCDLRLVKPYRFDAMTERIDGFIAQRVVQKRAANGKPQG